MYIYQAYKHVHHAHTGEAGDEHGEQEQAPGCKHTGKNRGGGGGEGRGGSDRALAVFTCVEASRELSLGTYSRNQKS